MPARTRTFALARIVPRAIGAGITAAVALLLLAAPALAHITISPDSAPAGSATVLTFHVPDEEAHADTVRVDIQIPTSHPIAQLLVEPVPGWTISVRTVTLARPVASDGGQVTQAVSEVIWSGGKIQPGQFQDFSVSADSLPAGVSQLAFKAIQTYSNGDVVRWIDLRQPGQPAPAHPAPLLRLVRAAPARPVAAASAGPGTDGMTRSLALAGLLTGLLALAAVGLRRRSPVLAGGGAAAPGTGRADRLAAGLDLARWPAATASSAAETAGSMTDGPRTAGSQNGGRETAGPKTSPPRPRRRRRR